METRTILETRQAQAASVMQELQSRILDLRTPSWLYALRRHCAGRASQVEELMAMLQELASPLAERTAVLEAGPMLASALCGAEVRGFLARGGALEPGLLAAGRRALAAMRELALGIGRDRLDLKGSALLGFWRDVVRLDAPFVRREWTSGLALPGEEDLAWELVLEEACPADPGRRERIQDLDESLRGFWDDCMLAEAAGACRLAANKLEMGLWVLDGPAKSSLVCRTPHACPFQDRNEIP